MVPIAVSLVLLVIGVVLHKEGRYLMVKVYFKSWDCWNSVITVLMIAGSVKEDGAIRKLILWRKYRRITFLTHAQPTLPIIKKLSQLIFIASQLTSFYIMGNTGHYELKLLTCLSPCSISIPLEHVWTRGFLTFVWGIEMKHW